VAKSKSFVMSQGRVWIAKGSDGSGWYGKGMQKKSGISLMGLVKMRSRVKSKDVKDARGHGEVFLVHLKRMYPNSEVVM
jgi:hypothetical protein